MKMEVCLQMPSFVHVDHTDRHLYMNTGLQRYKSIFHSENIEDI